MKRARSRPAETVGAAGGLTGFVIGVADHNWTAACVALAGLLPAIVTYLIAHGGLKGAIGAIWTGRTSRTKG